MKAIFTLLLTTLLLSGCAMAPPFTPTTMQGAQCKKECAKAQQGCYASSYTCDQGYSSCIESCIDIERVSKGR